MGVGKIDPAEFRRGVERRERLQVLLETLTLEQDLGPWRLKLDPQCVRRFGQCRAHKREIGVSLHHLLFSEWPQVEDTLRHEVAHALTFVRYDILDHGKLWVAACRVVGASPERLACIEAPTRDNYAARLNQP